MYIEVRIMLGCGEFEGTSPKESKFVRGGYPGYLKSCAWWWFEHAISTQEDENYFLYQSAC